MAKATDSAAALEIIESWDWSDAWDYGCECVMPLMLQLNDVINRLAMEGHHSAALATLALLADGRLRATGSFRWKSYRGGHYERDGSGHIPTRRWTDLQDALAASEDPFSPNKVTLRLISGDWKSQEVDRQNWDWRRDQFATVQVSEGDWLDDHYFEETFSASDIELRPTNWQAEKREAQITATANAEQNKGDAPAKYDWERAVAAIVFQWADEGSWQPASQADVKRRLADWFAENGHHPSDSMLKERAKWLFEEFSRRAGEADNLAA